MALSSFDFAAQTDVGLRYEGNEDSLAVVQHPNAEACLIIVADGVGGLKDGAYASNLAVEYARKAFEFAEGDFAKHVAEALVKASDDLYDRASGDDTRLAGTTVVAAILEPSGAMVLHAGDSRAYRYRDAALERLTRDHSWVNEQVDAGLMTPEEAEHSNRKNVITRCLGVEPETALDSAELPPLQLGEAMMLSSDGLHDLVPDAEMASIIARGGGLERICKDLVTRANNAGGRDNISVIIARPASG